MAKRRRGRGQGNQNANQQGQNQGQRRQADALRFWGDPDAKRTDPAPIRPTPDPAALVKSLGNPPLSPTASHQLAVVYEEAVRAATALAAANGLLAGDDLE
ncbi:MAG TPA: hypothetical protein VIL36_08030 [Acidimicrobiales bacterium]